MRRFLILLFICCLALPARLSAQTAAEYIYRGSESEVKGENDKAIADYTQALAIDAKNSDAYSSRAFVWSRIGEYDKAIADLTKCVGIDPKDTWAYYYRADERCRKGDYGKAITDYTTIAAIDPNYVSAYRELALIYATCPNAKYRDGKKAVENASKAYLLSGGENWSYPHTLAAAYAENGDFAKAREWEQKAIDSVPKEDKALLRPRLELYKQGKPYHEQPVKK